VASDVLEQLRSRVAAIRTERQKDGSVRTLAPATPPKTPVEKIPTKKLMMYSSAAFFVPFLIGLLWELNVQRVTDSTAMEKSNQLAPVVGEVAKLPSGTGRGRRLFAESIDTLRANLFISPAIGNLRTITVASSMSGEGKSSVASQLAISIAKATGETVLLVDADLRCPDQHDLFGLEMGPGLSSVISGNATLDEAIDSSLGDLVHVLPAGRLTNSPHRLINPQSMRALLDQALESYPFTVIDTAPVLSAGETLAVASATDVTLLCVLRDVSRMDSVTKTTNRLNAAGANLAGTVFNGVAARKYTYRYGDYHYALAGQSEA
jgi:capsular exopolysaccharide synthesis family protein